MGFISFLLYSVVLFFFGAFIGLRAEQKSLLDNVKQNKPAYIGKRVFKLKEIVYDPTEDPDRNSNKFSSTQIPICTNRRH